MGKMCCWFCLETHRGRGLMESLADSCGNQSVWCYHVGWIGIVCPQTQMSAHYSGCWDTKAVSVGWRSMRPSRSQHTGLNKRCICSNSAAESLLVASSKTSVLFELWTPVSSYMRMNSFAVTEQYPHLTLLFQVSRQADVRLMVVISSYHVDYGALDIEYQVWVLDSVCLRRHPTRHHQERVSLTERKKTSH